MERVRLFAAHYNEFNQMMPFSQSLKPTVAKIFQAIHSPNTKHKENTFRLHLMLLFLIRKMTGRKFNQIKA